MKKLFIVLVLSMAVICVYSQSKPIKIVNETGKILNVDFDYNAGCKDYGTQVSRGKTEVLKINGSNYFTLTISYYDHDRGRSVYFLRNSSIPFYSKDENCKGTLITVHTGMLNPTRDIKYVPNNQSGSSSWEITETIPCLAR